MGLKFEGALDSISEPQLAFIRDVLQKRGYKDTKVTFEAVGQAGDNYIANVKRIIVRDDNEEFRMIAKISPQDEMKRSNMDIGKGFNNEHIMYTKFLPKFQQLEEKAEIPKEDRLRFAECYGSFTPEPYEVILLEDLMVPGFSLLNRFNSLSNECVKSVLKNFASLHSLSFVLKHKEMQTFHEYNNSLFDVWAEAKMNPGINMYAGYLETFTLMIVDGEDRKRHLKGCVPQGFSIYSKLAKQDAGTKYTVIQQGDSWTNNILFKFYEDSPQSVLIDYQAARESSPTCDLLYMILNCTDHKARLEHFNDWIDYYHAELEKLLSYHGLKANYVYPRDQLDADLKRYAKVIFGLSVFITCTIYLKPEYAVKMMQDMQKLVDEQSKLDMNFDEESNQFLKKKFEDIVDSFVELGLLLKLRQ